MDLNIQYNQPSEFFLQSAPQQPTNSRKKSTDILLIIIALILIVTSFAYVYQTYLVGFNKTVSDTKNFTNRKDLAFQNLETIKLCEDKKATLSVKTDLITHEGCEPQEKENLLIVKKILDQLPTAVASHDEKTLNQLLTNDAKEVLKKYPEAASLAKSAKFSIDPVSWRRKGNVGSITVLIQHVLIGERKIKVTFFQEEDGWKLSETGLGI